MIIKDRYSKANLSEQIKEMIKAKEIKFYDISIYDFLSEQDGFMLYKQLKSGLMIKTVIDEIEDQYKKQLVKDLKEEYGDLITISYNKQE